MQEEFTPFLIKYLYKETSTSETLDVLDAIEQDSYLEEQFDQLLHAYHQLPKVQFQPPPKTLQQVLNYSRRTALERQC